MRAIAGGRPGIGGGVVEASGDLGDEEVEVMVAKWPESD